MTDLPPPVPYVPPPMPQAAAAWPPGAPLLAPPTRALNPALSSWTQALLWAVAATSALCSVFAWVAMAAVRNLARSSGAEAFADLERWVEVHDALGAVQAVDMLVRAAVFVVIIVWMYQAHRVTQLLWTGDRRWSQGWTIGGWFVPLANIALPRLVISEIERVAAAPRTGGRPTYHGRVNASAIGLLWWILFVVGLIMASIRVNSLDTPDQGWEVLYALQGLGHAVLVASGIAGALYIRRIASRLSPAGLREQP